ncbi:MAG: hypothetical protein IJ439_03580 [Tyzzerella sp.]|nr:hypothetical protein [Tyzzerella sp.]
MIKGTTTTGFEFELEDEVLDDYELLEVLCKVDKGEYNLVTEMVEKLLGEEQKERLKNHVRNICGKVSASKVMDEVAEIFQSSKEIKNS